MAPPNTRTREQFLELAKETVLIIQNACDSLERGGTVKEAKSDLKEISRKLTEIEWAYKACGW